MKRPKLYYVWKFMYFFCLEFAQIFESCAERGFWATLKAEYMQDAQSDVDQSDGCRQDPVVHEG